MLKIKLSPIGKKHEPHYRIVVADENSKLTGRAIAILGHFHPLTHQITADTDLVKAWIAKGAQPSEKIRRLLKI